MFICTNIKSNIIIIVLKKLQINYNTNWYLIKKKNVLLIVIIFKIKKILYFYSRQNHNYFVGIYIYRPKQITKYVKRQIQIKTSVSCKRKPVLNNTIISVSTDNLHDLFIYINSCIY